MPIQAKRWYEKLFELLIFLAATGFAYYALKYSERETDFYVFLALGFSYLYINVENLNRDSKHLTKNVEDNFGQIFESLQRKNDSIISLENEIFDLKSVNEKLVSEIADLRYEILKKQVNSQ
jgi:hypothetical protein